MLLLPAIYMPVWSSWVDWLRKWVSSKIWDCKGCNCHLRAALSVPRSCGKLCLDAPFLLPNMSGCTRDWCSGIQIRSLPMASSPHVTAPVGCCLCYRPILSNTCCLKKEARTNSFDQICEFFGSCFPISKFICLSTYSSDYSSPTWLNYTG